MDLLKLAALDAEDLIVISAHVQDAVTKVGDLSFQPAAHRFVIPMHRLAWETVSGTFRKTGERRQSVLHFDRVLSAKYAGIPRDNPADVLSLLAVRFLDGALPAGTVELDFSGGGTLRLEVECVEARLTDLGGAWQASSLPVHRV
ncbi:DUF2948 family protein [Mesorhizobium sp. NBSH29]|uniref:DUF2948 family protein n=1 Tax=Mesorhizobium sp. NBSH29 TaxID=2654249 RepID=UPI0018969D8E|nr:DUF2948 family protein [Mesorhizobium sp. NBSH29]QPC86765.1 DUF2948 family protein [Mesorhizobium sp. NBSH29]